MNKLIIILFSLSCFQLALAQDAYICIPISRTGFIFNESNKNWEQTKFKTNEDKKILKKNINKWDWRIFGKKEGWSACGSEDFGKGDDFNSAGFIFCNTQSGHLRMNKNSLRYIETYELGFIDGKDQNTHTPLIEIGTCSPL